jgi:hypothetical protein
VDKADRPVRHSAGARGGFSAFCDYDQKNDQNDDNDNNNHDNDNHYDHHHHGAPPVDVRIAGLVTAKSICDQGVRNGGWST